jgi:hypothetical protein
MANLKEKLSIPTSRSEFGVIPMMMKEEGETHEGDSLGGRPTIRGKRSVFCDNNVQITKKAGKQRGYVKNCRNMCDTAIYERPPIT